MSDKDEFDKFCDQIIENGNFVEFLVDNSEIVECSEPSKTMSDLLDTIRSIRSFPEESIKLSNINIAQFQIALEDVCSVVVERKSKKIAAGRECSEIVLWDFDLTDELYRITNYVKRFGTLKPNIMDDNKLDEEPTLLHGHSGPVYEMVFTHNSKLLLSSSGDSTLKVWSTWDGSCYGTYRATQSPVYSVHALSREPTIFLSGCGDGVAHLWDIERTIPYRLFGGHHHDVSCVRFHPSGNYFASAGSDGRVVLWDFRQKKMVRNLKLSTQSGSTKIEFSRDGRQLLVMGSERRISLWDMTSNSEHSCIPFETFSSIRSAAFSPEDRHFATCSPSDSSIVVWDNPGTQLCSKVSMRNVQIQTFADKLSNISVQFIENNLILAISKFRSQRGDTENGDCKLLPPPPPRPMTAVFGSNNLNSTNNNNPYDESTDEDPYESEPG